MSGREFDYFWERDRPFKFAAGGGFVKGWDRGMKVDGWREIIIAPRPG
ncbi:FKBP-type peptidyl-prolyl cis-trans isomerase [Streptomyces sp. NPDC001948]